MLSLVYVLNFLSRQLPAILAKPIQEDLRISDGQLGRLADKTNRTRVLAAACAIWSIATMCTGLAANYWQFVIAYMAVGFGEAGGVPPSYSIITDYFPSGRRGTALGVYNLGPGLGATLGIAFGASIAAAFNWRDALLFFDSMGVVAALCVLVFVREPVRGGMDAFELRSRSVDTGFSHTFSIFFASPSLRLAALASGATQFITYGLTNFTVLFLMREKGMTLRQVAAYYSLVVLAGVGASMVVSGRLIDRFTRSSKQAYALIPATSLALAVMPFLGFAWAQNWRIALVFLTGTIFLNYFYLSCAVTFIQEEVRPDQRVMSGALLLLVMNFIGLGLGPTYVGAASDYFHVSYPQQSLQYALYTLAPFYLVAILLFLKLAGVLRKEERIRGEIVP